MIFLKIFLSSRWVYDQFHLVNKRIFSEWNVYQKSNLNKTQILFKICLFYYLNLLNYFKKKNTSFFIAVLINYWKNKWTPFFNVYFEIVKMVPASGSSICSSPLAWRLAQKVSFFSVFNNLESSRQRCRKNFSLLNVKYCPALRHW